MSVLVFIVAGGWVRGGWGSSADRLSGGRGRAVWQTCWLALGWSSSSASDPLRRLVSAVCVFVSVFVFLISRDLSEVIRKESACFFAAALGHPHDNLYARNRLRRYHFPDSLSEILAHELILLTITPGFRKHRETGDLRPPLAKMMSTQAGWP